MNQKNFSKIILFSLKYNSVKVINIKITNIGTKKVPRKTYISKDKPFPVARAIKAEIADGHQGHEIKVQAHPIQRIALFFLVLKYLAIVLKPTKDVIITKIRLKIPLIKSIISTVILFTIPKL